MKLLIYAAGIFLLPLMGVSQNTSTGIAEGKLLSEKDTSVLNPQLRQLSSSNQEKDLLMLNRYYKMKGMNVQADSLTEIIVSRFPGGDLAFFRLKERALSETNLDLQEELCEKIKRSFPDKDLGGVYAQMAEKAARLKDCQRMERHLRPIAHTKFGEYAALDITELIITNDSLSGISCFHEYALQQLKLLNEHVKKDTITEDAPGFELTDLEGKKVSLQSFKGKTVVLDFWATWCSPCKKSFPGMQKAIEYYSKDTSVQFLFISTANHNLADPFPVVSKYIAENNFPFHVVIDPQLPATKKYKMSDDYKITALPTKIVIDPNGKICFRAIGFAGGNAILVKELAMMIEIAKSRRAS